jgi:hypothetical protein
MGGNPINPAGGAAAGPCKISADPSGEYNFQIRVADMPLNAKLCGDHQGASPPASFNLIKVRSLLASPPTVVPGQPTAMTATTFSLTLPVGGYYIGVVINPLPSAAIVYVYEDCAGSNQLTDILADVQQESGHFTLRVV